MNEEASALEKLLAAAVAAAAAFLVAGGALFLLVGSLEGWAHLALFAAAPAAILALLPFTARLFCLVLGLLAFAGSVTLELGGAHNPLFILPWIAICLAGAAPVAELSVRALRHMLRPKRPRA